MSVSTTISSESSLERIFTKDYIYPDWFTKKKYQFYKKILQRLQKLRYLHTRASQYYDKLKIIIFAPSISITAISGIASFLSTSEFISNDMQNAFGVSVGVMASIATMLQSLASVCKFDTKSEAHRTAAEEYGKLMTRLKFEMEMPNEEDFTDKMEANILDIQNKCVYFVPQFIIEEFSKQKKINEEKKHTEIKNDEREKNYGTFNSQKSMNYNKKNNVHLNIQDVDQNKLENKHDFKIQIDSESDSDNISNTINNKLNYNKNLTINDTNSSNIDISSNNDNNNDINNNDINSNHINNNNNDINNNDNDNQITNSNSQLNFRNNHSQI